MSETTLSPDAATKAELSGWRDRLETLTEESGYYEPLGTHHSALFLDEGPCLLVTFERLADILARPDQLPRGAQIASQKGWSHLCLIADGDTWYRDERVYRYFDRLVDDAFFEDFDRVVFYGAGMAGYAACAYSVTAPGASVVAVQPRATLDPAQAGWDLRDTGKRRLNFTDRYGYAPDMIDGTGEVFVLFDPMQRLDAMHAALLAKPFVTALRMPNMGSTLDIVLEKLDILAPILLAAGDGSLTRNQFALWLRKRRSYGTYLKSLLAIVEERGQTTRVKWICKSVTSRLHAPWFRKRLAEIEALEAKSRQGAPETSGT